MKKPPDPSFLPLSTLCLPSLLKSAARSPRSCSSGHLFLRISSIRSLSCHIFDIFLRILLLRVGLGFGCVKSYRRLHGSLRALALPSQVWHSLASTVRGQVLHSPFNDGILHSALPHLCDEGCLFRSADLLSGTIFPYIFIFPACCWFLFCDFLIWLADFGSDLSGFCTISDFPLTAP